MRFFPGRALEKCCTRLVLMPLCLLMAGTWQSPGAEEGRATPALTLRGNKPYSWWNLGEDVVFKSAGAEVPADLKTLEGRISNVSDQFLETVTVSRDQFLAEGWKWQPKSPGFYDIEFSWTDAEDKATKVSVPFTMKAPNGNKGRFERGKFSLAVTERPDPDRKHVGQFGFHYHLETREIPLAQLIGYDFAFIHSIPWGNYYTDKKKAIEPERGVYNWDILDTSVRALTAAKFEIAAQFLYTPAWASPHPEKADQIAICLPVSSAYAPANMDDFTNFVEKTVLRYKDRIKIWEIWNEPNMPNGSIYWFDTPENYVRLLQAGYKAVKKVQPEAEVWNGGIGMRLSYHAFYDKILQGGASGYFDKLSLHGVSTDVEDFRRIEKQNNVPHKEAVMSEWHAVLVGNMSDKLMDSEPGLSMRMMRDQLIQIKQGLTKTVMFEISNQTEKETINFGIANKWFTHSSGLFRTTPRVEPRHAAVVMATFIAAVGGQASFVKEVEVGKGGYGILLSTGKGKLLAVWADKETLEVSDLKVFTKQNSVLRDWEGKGVALNGAAALESKKIYYLSNPDEGALARASSADRLVPAARIQRGSLDAPTASFLPGKILEAPVLQNAPWITDNWKNVSLKGGEGKADFTTRALVGVHEDGVDVLVEVKDATHVQNQADSWWMGDSLQLAIDCEGRGMNGGNMELVAALKPDGVVFRKLAVANAGADLPAGITGANEDIRQGSCKIAREGETTVYRIHLPWSELYPMAFNPKSRLKISLLVNDNNGEGRAGYLEWGSGIAGNGANEKDPARYGTLKPAGEK